VVPAQFIFFFQTPPPPVSRTGVGAITEAPDVLAGTGMGARTGVGAITGAPDVAQGTGKVDVLGTGAIQQAPDIGAGTFGAPAVGDAAITQAPDTAIGTGTIGTGQMGAGAIQQAPDVAAGTGRVAITGAGAIQQAPDTPASSALPAQLGTIDPNRTGFQEADQFITYGLLDGKPLGHGQDKPKKPAVTPERDLPRLRQLGERNKKLEAESKRLQAIREQMEALAGDKDMEELLAAEAAKAAAEFSRVAKNYLSLDRRNKMMALLLALLME
jgi:hypothetical protein